MIRQLGRNTAMTFAITGALIVLAACGRSGDTSVPPTLNTWNPFGNNNRLQNGTGTGTLTLPPITSNPSTNPGNGTNLPPSGGTGTGGTPQPLNCTLTLMSGVPTATQMPQAPVFVEYLLIVSPAVTSVLQPLITTTPVNAFTVAQLTPNGSQVTVRGSFNIPGSVTVRAAVNISGQPIACEVVSQVTQFLPAQTQISRWDRISPPDILYSTSETVWAGGSPNGYRRGGPMFNVFTQAPPATFCRSVPVNQCMLPRNPSPVHFLTQEANCGGFPLVGQLGFACATNVPGTTPLYRGCVTELIFAIS